MISPLARVVACLVASFLVTVSMLSHFTETVSSSQQLLDPPECWRIGDEVTFTGALPLDSPEAIERVSIYEIHDDDSVNPNHLLTGLGYYGTLTWQGSDDVEWLVLDGEFDSYTINGANHSVTFYGLRNWLHVVYRTRNFVIRPEDQIRFCVIGQNSNPWPTQVRVSHPASYQIVSVSPSGYTIPAAGEIRWELGTTSQFQIDTRFRGLGPDRPLLDFPADYQDRSTGSSTSFSRAFNGRITSKFDHRSPNYTYDTKFLPYNGIELDDPPGVNCTFGFNCYDGHDGYDIDDRCPPQAPCSDPRAVFPAAQGTIISESTGWHNVLGCRVTIGHGNGWTTEYSHLEDAQNNHSCSGILVGSGQVSRTQRIGTIGSSGSGSGGTTHLHFVVRHNGRVADPSGWEPNPQTNPDPWSNHPNGTPSYPMWLHSIRTTQAFDPNHGGQLVSPTHQVTVDIPNNFYYSPLTFNLSNEPVAETSAGLVNTGHSFSLTAFDFSGNAVHQLNRSLTLSVEFTFADVASVDQSTLSIYNWDPGSDAWTAVPTTIDWGTLTAVAQVDHLSVFALLGRPRQRVFVPIIVKGSGCNISNGVVLYEHPDFQGRCSVFTGDHPDFNVLGFNDVASSIRFVGSYASGWEALVYEHTYYTGASSAFQGDDRNFGGNTIGNDRASSIQLHRLVTDPDDGRVILSGQQLNGTISPSSDVDTYLFDANSGMIVSIRMDKVDASLDSYLILFDPSGTEIARDDDSGGNLNALISGVGLVQSGRYSIVAHSWGNASSGRYTLRTDLTTNNACPPVASGVILYEHSGYAGRCLVLTGDHPDLNWVGFNDMASSIRFIGSYSSGWEAEVFEHTYYLGASSEFRGNDPSFGDNTVGDNRAFSIRIRQVQRDATPKAVGTPIPGGE